MVLKMGRYVWNVEPDPDWNADPHDLIYTHFISVVGRELSVKPQKQQRNKQTTNPIG